ncbi:MAG: nucleoside triphosphate pyrophosphohydrolase [Myxococcota bacterium]|nr:nucleoside triphosphate pyrophosphohydrolase [Myxococcota bacterium]
MRAPGGCPWDREQTPSSLKPYIIEEAYEVLDAIDSGAPEPLCEELGDLLLQVVLQSEIADEAQSFDIADVTNAISRKLVSRHPHVFGDAQAKTAAQVLTNWEKLKHRESGGQKGLFDGLPRGLPALQRAARMGEKAGRLGFDWPSTTGVREKVDEELAELEEAVTSGDRDAMTHELGDVLFSIAQWARHLGLQPEESLAAGCERFKTRFSRMQALAVADREGGLDGLSIDEMEAYWQRAKRQ